MMTADGLAAQREAVHIPDAFRDPDTARAALLSEDPRHTVRHTSRFMHDNSPPDTILDRLLPAAIFAAAFVTALLIFYGSW